MKILLITGYWSPWNASGTFRWWEIGKFLHFDVLTSKKPRKAYLDKTMDMYERNEHRTFRYGTSLPAILWGVMASFIVIFKRGYKRYIFTSPPESLLLGAWICQLLGRVVIVDMRDDISRDNQKHKWLIPVYKFFYKRIRNRVVCWQFLDEKAFLIPHGYPTNNKYPTLKKIYDFNIRLSYRDWRMLLRIGYIPDIKKKPAGYAASSLPSIRNIVGEGEWPEHVSHLHPETKTFDLLAWEEVADLYFHYIYNLVVVK